MPIKLYLQKQAAGCLFQVNSYSSNLLVIYIDFDYLEFYYLNFSVNKSIL